MNPELSRRVAKIMHSQEVLALSLDERIALADAVTAADSFEQLPEQYQRLILQAEQAPSKPKVKFKTRRISDNQP